MAGALLYSLKQLSKVRDEWTEFAHLQVIYELLDSRPEYLNDNYVIDTVFSAAYNNLYDGYRDWIDKNYPDFVKSDYSDKHFAEYLKTGEYIGYYYDYSDPDSGLFIRIGNIYYAITMVILSNLNGDLSRVPRNNL